MNENEIILTFKITRYNMINYDFDQPHEMNLIINKKVSIDDNFINVIENIASTYKIGDKLNYYLEGIYETLWSEHFDGVILDEILKNINLQNYDSLNTKIECLDKQFNLKNKVINIVILAHDSKYFMKFFFHIDSKDKVLPHVHCKCCGLERIINLNTLEFIEHPFLSESITKRAINIAYRYRSEFMEYFESLTKSGDELIEFKIVI